MAQLLLTLGWDAGEVGESGGYGLGRGYSHQLVVSADRLRYIGLCHPHSLGKDKKST